MRKKLGLFWFAAALLGAALIFAGCENPAGSDGAAGAPGAIYLSGEVTTDGIKDALASGAPVVFAGVIQSDAGVVVIEAGKAVKLVGTAAYTPVTGGTLLLRAASSVTGAGLIDASAGAVIGPTEVAGNVSGTLIAFQEGDSPITFPGGIAAVLGDVTVGTGTGALSVATLANNTLYVIGDLTVSAEIPSANAPKFYVLGDATVSEAQTAAVVWDVSGTLTASKAPTNGGNINAAKLDIKGAGTAVTFGKVDVGELETAASVVITTGTSGNGLTAGTVTGAATFATGAVITSAAFGGAVTFNGAATLGDVTLAATSVVTLSTGAVTLTANKTIKVGSDTVLTAGAAAVVLTPAATGATLTAAAKKLTLGAQNLTLTSGTLTVANGSALAVATGKTLNVSGTLTVNGTLNATAGSIVVGTTASTTLAKASVVGDATTGATLAGATGTVTLAATDKIELADTGVITIVSTGSIVAGATTFSGAGTWTASVSTAGGDDITGVAITSNATTAPGATIAAVGTTGTGTLTAGGTVPAITQAAVASNNLTIGENTAIDLGGNSSTALGKLILTGDTSPAKLVFEKTTSFVQVGATFTTNTAFSTAAKIGGKAFGGTSKPGVYTSVTGAAGTFLGLKAGTAGDDLTAGNSSSDTITIDSTQAVAAS